MSLWEGQRALSKTPALPISCSPWRAITAAGPSPQAGVPVVGRLRIRGPQEMGRWELSALLFHSSLIFSLESRFEISGPSLFPPNGYMGALSIESHDFFFSS